MHKCRYWLLVLGTAILANACTVGVFPGRVTADGRPMLWKNRDVDNADQAVRFFTDGRYPYLANVYAGETDYAWSGINAAGFAIMNANSFNIGSGAPEGLNDGQVMKLALQECATIDEFRQLLDSLNTVGRTTPCNMGVMDASGATAMFEAGAYSYVAWYSESLPEGYIVRANFSLSADTTGEKSNNRYLRASQLVARAVGRNELDRVRLIDSVARDLGQVDFDPYPLPYTGSVQSMPPGMLPATATISRTKTRSVIVIVGPRPGEPVALSAMWAMLGEPSISLAAPVWVGAQGVPHGLVDEPTAALCDEAKRMKTYVYSDWQYPGAVNSFRVAEINQFLGMAAEEVNARADSCLERWAQEPPSATDFARAAQDAAGIALREYARFWQAHPDEEPRESTDREFRVITYPGERIIMAVFPGASGNRRLLVHDAAGRQVAAFELSNYPVPGLSYFQWGAGGLASGLYFATLESVAARRTCSFVFIR